MDKEKVLDMLDEVLTMGVTRKVREKLYEIAMEVDKESRDIMELLMRE